MITTWCMRAAKALARLRICTVSPEISLLDIAKSNRIQCSVSNVHQWPPEGVVYTIVETFTSSGMRLLKVRAISVIGHITFSCRHILAQISDNSKLRLWSQWLRVNEGRLYFRILLKFALGQYQLHTFLYFWFALGQYQHSTTARYMYYWPEFSISLVKKGHLMSLTLSDLGQMVCLPDV